MKNILLDTNVVIDLLQNRQPWVNEARQIFEALARKELNGCITAKSLADIHYVSKHQLHDESKTRSLIAKLLDYVSILDTSAADCVNALMSSMSDYADAIMAETAARCGMDCIVTRNVKDFAKSPVKPIFPSDFLQEDQRL